MPELDIISAAAAYAGLIGEQRERFCSRFSQEKQEAFQAIEGEIFAKIAAGGETATCHKGCSVCCVLFIEASIQECEAIVYSLYRGPDKMSRFLQRYEDWRLQMRLRGNPFDRCEEVLHGEQEDNLSQSDQEVLLRALSWYHRQNLTCPFLDHGVCSIYEVRPYACSNHYVTTPAEWCAAENWCNPRFPHRPRIYMTDTDRLYGLSFYHGNLRRPVVSFAPTTVYRILTEGLEYVARLTGIDTLLIGK